MANRKSSNLVLKSVGSPAPLRLPKSIQKIASLEAKYFSSFAQNQAHGLLDQYLEQQGGVRQGEKSRGGGGGMIGRNRYAFITEM